MDPAKPPSLDAEALEAFIDLEPTDYGAHDETGPIIYGVGLVVPGVVLALLAYRGLRARVEIARAERVRPSDTLAPGPVVLRGTVRCLDEGGDPAFRVTIEQTGVEQKSSKGKSWTTTWLETDRKTEMSPFELELRDGSRVLCEPDATARLIDGLGPWERRTIDTRVAVASLEAGEVVSVSGELVRSSDPTGGYRGGERLVLRPERGGGMLLSTLGRGDAGRARLRQAVGHAAILILATIVVHLFALPFHVGVLFGETRSAIVERTWVVEKPPHKGNDQSEYYVSYLVPSESEPLVDEVSRDDLRLLPVGAVVLVHVSPIQTTIGPHPTVHAALALPQALLLFVLSVFIVWRRPGRRWYEGATRESVPGRLADS